MKTSIKLSFLHFRFLISKRKLFLVLAFLFIIMYLNFSPLISIAKDYYQKIDVSILVFGFSNPMSIMVYSMSVLIIFSQLPLKNSFESILRFKTSTREWLSSQVLSILQMGIFHLFSYLSCLFLILNRNLMVGPSWGKIIGSLYYYQGFVHKYNLKISVSGGIFTNLDHYKAVFLFLLIYLLVFYFSSLTIMLLNLIRQGLGITIYTFLMVLQFSVDIFGDNRLYYFSPLSWLNINNLSVASFETFPNIYWVASVLSVAIIVEILIILASNTIFEISFES